MEIFSKNITSPVSSPFEVSSRILMDKAAGGVPLFKTMKMIEDLGRLFTTDKENRKDYYAIFECPFCKKHFKASKSHVKTGHTQSCGCKSHELTATKKTVHGISSHPIYGIWRNMVQRCTNPKEKEYKNYGARGITICDEWRGSITTFYEWAIQNGYQKGLIFDRENNDGNYEPFNCRWVTTNISAENNRLIRKSNKSGYRGVFFRKKKNLKKPWKANIQWNYVTYKLGYYSTAVDAAMAYNNFVTQHKTNHPLNKI